MYKQHALMRRCGLRYKEVITEWQRRICSTRCGGHVGPHHYRDCFYASHRYDISSYCRKRTRVWLHLIIAAAFGCFLPPHFAPHPPAATIRNAKCTADKIICGFVPSALAIYVTRTIDPFVRHLARRVPDEFSQNLEEAELGNAVKIRYSFAKMV